jgi:hypothetical protein
MIRSIAVCSCLSGSLFVVLLNPNSYSTRSVASQALSCVWRPVRLRQFGTFILSPLNPRKRLVVRRCKIIDTDQVDSSDCVVGQ